MSLSLGQLRSNPPQDRPERSVNVCLAQHLIAEVQSLSTELDDIASQAASAPPRRMNQPKENPRAAEIKDRLADLIEEMSKYSGDLRIRATKTDGEWRLWTNEHPAREEGEPGRERDERVTGLTCNADDLMDELAVYVVGWESDDLKDGDFAKVFEPVLATADKLDIARTVVALYESRLDFPRWRSGLSASLERLNDSSSPSLLESVTDDSTAGSPEVGSKASTKKGNPAA